MPTENSLALNSDEIGPARDQLCPSAPPLQIIKELIVETLDRLFDAIDVTKAEAFISQSDYRLLMSCSRRKKMQQVLQLRVEEGRHSMDFNRFPISTQRASR